MTSQQQCRHCGKKLGINRVNSFCSHTCYSKYSLKEKYYELSNK